MSKPEPATSTATITASVTIGAIVICGNCGIEERRLLHHVRHRGIFRRLCTTCVLRLHPQFFCPTCFLVYERSPPPDCVTCFKCYSSSHPNCVSTSPAPSKSPYVCPSCINPNLPIFSLKKVRDESAGAVGENITFSRAIDKKGAKVLLAAARVAAITMNKAAVAARAEAERRAKEAAFTKKRAREALENLVYLMAKEKKKNFKPATANSGVVVNRVERVDSSIEVLEALNAVELKEKEKLAVVSKVENAMVPAVCSNGAAMEVDDDERLEAAMVVYNDGKNEKIVDSGNLDKSENVVGEEVNNVVGLGSLVDQPQAEKSSHPIDEKVVLQQ